MAPLRSLLIGMAAVAVAACSSGHSTRPPTPDATTISLPPVHFETAFPNLQPVARPTALLEVSGEHWMLLESQDGRILGFPNAPSASEYTTVWDNRTNTSRQGNEEGLLGLALDPNFASNGYIYVYYSAAGGERRTVLSRLTTTGGGASLRVAAGSELVILQEPQPSSVHKGGQLAFGPDGMLYLGLGDGGPEGDPTGNGQDITRDWLGSIIRIDVRNATTEHPYATPRDNPFAGGASGARPETWAYGFRNPWRFSFDRQTGVLWIGDVGQANWEEVDIGQAGANYGWNIMEGSHCYQPSSGCEEDGLVLPVTEYSHADGACAITGGYVYRGQAIPKLDGYYVYGDYCSGVVRAFPAAGAAAGSKPPLTTLRTKGPEVASFARDASGELYLLGFDGAIQKLVP